MATPATTSIVEPRASREEAETEVARIARDLAERGATLIVLFGSRARGDAIRGSDADLLIVMPCPEGETFAGRLARVASESRPRVPIDLLVYTPEEFERMREESPFVRKALAEGKVLHAA